MLPQKASAHQYACAWRTGARESMLAPGYLPGSSTTGKRTVLPAMKNIAQLPRRLASLHSICLGLLAELLAHLVILAVANVTTTTAAIHLGCSADNGSQISAQGRFAAWNGYPVHRGQSGNLSLANENKNHLSPTPFRFEHLDQYLIRHLDIQRC
jgi:hypothetical protein